MTEKGEFFWLSRENNWAKNLVALLPCSSPSGQRLAFVRFMRWGVVLMRLFRPVHGLVALFGETVVPVVCFGIASDRTTRGHRFLRPDPIVLGFLIGMKIS